MIYDSESLLPHIEWSTRGAFQDLASAFEKLTGLGLKVRSGARTCATQNVLYAQGRSAPGSIVTDARGCQSWHVMGRAVDADPVDPKTGAIVTAPKNYALLGALWAKLGGVWGGNFSDLGDYGHFEYHPKLTIEGLCPDPDRCVVFPIDSSDPLWPWVLVSAALAGAAAWVLVGRKGSPAP